MVTKIIVNLELGHVAKTLDVPTLSGHTHEWVMFVKGADGMVIDHFVEKVVFWLHESYNPSQVIVKSPPYQVKQSGYAGFNILIDIHFKNRSEPKSVRFHYDLFLHQENMPPVNHTRVEMLTFSNPAEDFKKRLIKAGGIVKTQEAQIKERKVHKENRHSEEKQSRSGRDKHESDKVRHKTQHIDKTKQSNEDKRRSGSVSEDVIPKRKHEDKLSSSRPTTDSKSSKEKEKINKLKIKMEPPSSMGNLFSIDDSIFVKQIKKKEPTGSESRKDKEKRVEPKVKKEFSSKQEFSEKKIRKQSPVVQKVKQSKEGKPRRPRPMASSDESDIQKSSAILAQSDSDAEVSYKKKKKHSVPDKVKVKKLMKRSKNTPEKSAKKSFSTRMPSKDIARPSEAEKIAQTTELHANKPSKQHRKLSESSYVEKKGKIQSIPEKSKTTVSSMKISSKPTQRSSTPLTKKDKHASYHSSSPVQNVEVAKRERKSQPSSSPRFSKSKRPQISLESSSTSSSSSDEAEMLPMKDVPKHVVSPVFPMSTSSSDSPTSEIPSFNLPSDELEDPLNPPHHELNASATTDNQMDDSGSEPATFTQDVHLDNTDSTLETSDEKIDQDYTKESKDENLVRVGIGDTLNYYPHMTKELFEKFRKLQILLSKVTDEARLRKIFSIIRRSGTFTQDSETMDFDFCNLDKKTIHRLEKQLSLETDT